MRLNDVHAAKFSEGITCSFVILYSLHHIKATRYYIYGDSAGYVRKSFSLGILANKAITF